MDDKARLTKKLTEFINTWPLYSPFELEFSPPTHAVPDLPATILRACSVCDATPTWEQQNPTGSGYGLIYVGFGSVVGFTCTHCKEGMVRVWFRRDDYRAKGTADGKIPGIERSVFRKLGQWPAQRTDPDREVSKQLSDPLLDLFSKGLTSLAHGYGLGALVYFRRVVEEATSQLIDLFADRAEAAGDSQSAQEIRAAKNAPHMEERLKVAGDALPTALRPGGVNPLTVLYAHYSRGIHGLNDNECLAVAQQLRFALEYIFINWRNQMEDAARFRRTVQNWTDPAETHEG
jgi:hypothetical protein